MKYDSFRYYTILQQTTRWLPLNFKNENCQYDPEIELFCYALAKYSILHHQHLRWFFTQILQFHQSSLFPIIALLLLRETIKTGYPIISVSNYEMEKRGESTQMVNKSR